MANNPNLPEGDQWIDEPGELAMPDVIVVHTLATSPHGNATGPVKMRLASPTMTSSLLGPGRLA